MREWFRSWDKYFAEIKSQTSCGKRWRRRNSLAIFVYGSFSSKRNYRLNARGPSRRRPGGKDHQDKEKPCRRHRRQNSYGGVLR